jgi:hypothetical protein
VLGVPQVLGGANAGSGSIWGHSIAAVSTPGSFIVYDQDWGDKVGTLLVRVSAPFCSDASTLFPFANASASPPFAFWLQLPSNISSLVGAKSISSLVGAWSNVTCTLNISSAAGALSTTLASTAMRYVQWASTVDTLAQLPTDYPNVTFTVCVQDSQVDPVLRASRNLWTNVTLSAALQLFRAAPADATSRLFWATSNAYPQHNPTPLLSYSAGSSVKVSNVAPSASWLSTAMDVFWATIVFREGCTAFDSMQLPPASAKAFLNASNTYAQLQNVFSRASITTSSVCPLQVTFTGLAELADYLAVLNSVQISSSLGTQSSSTDLRLLSLSIGYSPSIEYSFRVTPQNIAPQLAASQLQTTEGGAAQLVITFVPDCSDPRLSPAPQGSWSLCFNEINALSYPNLDVSAEEYALSFTVDCASQSCPCASSVESCPCASLEPAGPIVFDCAACNNVSAGAACKPLACVQQRFTLSVVVDRLKVIPWMWDADPVAQNSQAACSSSMDPVPAPSASYFLADDRLACFRSGPELLAFNFNMTGIDSYILNPGVPESLQALTFAANFTLQLGARANTSDSVVVWSDRFTFNQDPGSAPLPLLPSSQHEFVIDIAMSSQARKPSTGLVYVLDQDARHRNAHSMVLNALEPLDSAPALGGLILSRLLAPARLGNSSKVKLDASAYACKPAISISHTFAEAFSLIPLDLSLFWTFSARNILLRATPLWLDAAQRVEQSSSTGALDIPLRLITSNSPVSFALRADSPRSFSLLGFNTSQRVPPGTLLGPMIIAADADASQNLTFSILNVSLVLKSGLSVPFAQLPSSCAQLQAPCYDNFEPFSPQLFSLLPVYTKAPFTDLVTSSTSLWPLTRAAKLTLATDQLDTALLLQDYQGDCSVPCVVFSLHLQVSDDGLFTPLHSMTPSTPATQDRATIYLSVLFDNATSFAPSPASFESLPSGGLSVIGGDTFDIVGTNMGLRGGPTSTFYAYLSGGFLLAEQVPPTTPPFRVECSMVTRMVRARCLSPPGWGANLTVTLQIPGYPSIVHPLQVS